MKIIIKCFFLIVLGLGAGLAGFSKSKAIIEVKEAKLVNQTVELTLHGNKPFPVGNNLFILHVDGKEFSHSRQAKKTSDALLTFLIPVADFRSLREGSTMYVTYGHSGMSESSLETFSKEAQGTCWKIGLFSATLLH
jgi:hypothetical protein